jgi:hypothetical protein
MQDICVLHWITTVWALMMFIIHTILNTSLADVFFTWSALWFMCSWTSVKLYG